MIESDLACDELMILKQRDLVDLCLSEGWNPFFLQPSDEALHLIKPLVLREIEVAIADSQKKVVRRILSYLRQGQVRDLADEIASLTAWRLEDSFSKLGQSPKSSPANDDAQGILLESLELMQLPPRFLDQKSEAGLAELCGREMKHLCNLQRHDAVVQLGQRAAWLKLEHKRIAVALRKSRLSVRRANRLIVLKAYKESPNRERRDYEDAILTSWLADPECSEYVDLLGKVVAYRQRKQTSTISLDAFETEWVDYRVNKRLWHALSQGN